MYVCGLFDSFAPSPTVQAKRLTSQKPTLRKRYPFGRKAPSLFALH
jgi:hypothetical protein